MTGHDAAEQLGVVEQRLATLSAAVEQESAGQQSFPQIREQLHAALQDLQAAKDALRQQNEALAAARQTVEVQRQRYHDLFEFAPDSYVVTDLEGTVWEANQAAAGLLQASQAALVRKPLIVFIAEGGREDFRARLADLRRLEGPEEWEVALQARDGQVIAAAAKVGVIRDAEGRGLGLRWLFRDIRERKRAEEQARQFNQQLERRVHERTAELEAANRLKDEWLLREQVARAAVEAAQARLAFLAEASHVLSASLEYRTTLDHVASLAVPHLCDWCIVTLVEEDGSIRPVAVGHTDPKKADLVREMYRVHAIDPQATEGAARVIRTGKPALYPRITDAQLKAIARDPEHLNQLRELGGKSAVVMPLLVRGRTLGALMLVAAGSRRTYSTVDLAWLDDLAGRIATAIDNARLYRRLVEMNGSSGAGNDGAPSEKSECLVASPAVGSASTSKAESTNGGSGDSGGPPHRVLLVDDNIDAVETLAMLLQIWGHQVDVAHSGEDALQMARRNAPDLVLLDIGLPGMDGYDLARQLRELPNVGNPLLVALTGYGQEDDRRRSQDAGIDIHLIKPIGPGMLQKMLGQLGKPVINGSLTPADSIHPPPRTREPE